MGGEGVKLAAVLAADAAPSQWQQQQQQVQQQQQQQVKQQQQQQPVWVRVMASPMYDLVERVQSGAQPQLVISRPAQQPSRMEWDLATAGER